MSKDNPSLSGMSGHGASVSGESPDKQHIPCNNKIKNTSDTSIQVKESIQVQENPSKMAKEDSIPDAGGENTPTI